MILDYKPKPRIDSLLELTVLKVNEGDLVPDYYWSADVFPLSNDRLPYEWYEDWLEPPSYAKDTLAVWEGETEIKVLKSGYLIVDYNLTSLYEYSILYGDIDNIGLEETLSHITNEIIKIHDIHSDFQEGPETKITLAFGASCHTDWETGYPECEPFLLGYFDYFSGQIKELEK